eukprot:gene68603-94004_t
MAKESIKARDRKKAACVAKYAVKRASLKEAGRPRGYMRKFGINRVTFREMASKGLIPGVTKAS